MIIFQNSPVITLMAVALVVVVVNDHTSHSFVVTGFESVTAMRRPVLLATFGLLGPRRQLLSASSPARKSLFSTASSDDGESRSEAPRTNRWLVLSRPHERSIFLFYAVASTAALCVSGAQSQSLLMYAETGVALTWASMILAISFLEAWVKFKAPFLKKYVAVDVGRHVFAALNAAELAFCGSFWVGRVVQCYRIREATGFFLRNRVYYRQPTFVLPVMATAALLTEVILVAPRLFLRAKARIVQGFDEVPVDVKDAILNEAEQRELDYISREVDERKSSMPSPTWHRVYALLELLKVASLQTFVVLTWMKIK
jgi:hypothetical protein